MKFTIFHTFKLFFIVLILIVIVFVIPPLFGSSIAFDWTAEKVFQNVRIPAFREPPTTSFGRRSSTSVTQIVGGKGEGLSCSLPSFVAPFAFPNESDPIELQMRQACITHDYCYRHGAATYGYSQEDCDYRLIDDAARLCAFISRQNSIQHCTLQAKKVLLGVRLFGSGSFHPARATQEGENSSGIGTSTYFEYDSYPGIATDYSAYRLVRSSGGAFALYEFRYRPNGLRVYEHRIRMVGKNSFPVKSVRRFDVPANYRWRSSPPQIVERSLPDGKTETWFYWFQRNSVDNTGSRFVFLNPLTADSQAWSWAFNQSDKAESFIDNETESVTAFKTEPENSRAKNNSSEFVSGPFYSRRDGKLSLYSLRTHSCIVVRVICLSIFPFDPSKPEQAFPPRSAGDVFNNWREEPKHRYKNLVIPPIVYPADFVYPGMNGVYSSSVMGWFQRTNTPPATSIDRGEALLGKRAYQHALYVRQARPIRTKSRGETSVNAGTLRLDGMTERAEPFFLSGNKSSSHGLISFFQSKDPYLHPPPIRKNSSVQSFQTKLEFWPLDYRGQSSERDGITPVSPIRLSPDAGRSLPNASWFQRPMLVLKSTRNGQLVLLSRVLETANKVFLELMIGEVIHTPGHLSWRVLAYKERLFEGSKSDCKDRIWFVPCNEEARGHRLQPISTLEQFNSTPILASLDEDKREIDLFFPIRRDYCAMPTTAKNPNKSRYCATTIRY